MARFIRSTISSIALLGFVAATAQAADPVDKCHSGKLKESAKYASCRLLTASKAVSHGATPDFTQCTSKLTSKFTVLETKAGPMVCLTESDASSIGARIAGDTDDIASLLAGSAVPGCKTDLLACNSVLETCEGDLVVCDGTLTTCTSGLATCTSGLSTCTGNLSVAENGLATCNDNLDTCNNGLSTCNSNLTTCNGSLATCSGSLGTCNAGTAVAGNVFAGKTFSSGAGYGLTGTMANVGQQNVTPGTAAVTITQGYHDGTGSVAGDADLVPASITSGVTLFGVIGTALPEAQPRQTGQTTCYDDTGNVIACAATGQDGELQKGAARSFTDNGDGTVTDNTTGLMWEKMSDDGSIHDKDTLYWWELAFTKVATLNSGSFAGFSDWRVPNINELDTLVNAGAHQPAAYSVFNTACPPGCTVLTCNCTEVGRIFWSSTSYAAAPTYAWVIGTTQGEVQRPPKTGTFLVRAVRAGS